MKQQSKSEPADRELSRELSFLERPDLDAVRAHHPVNRVAVNAQHPRRLTLIAARGSQHPEQVLTFHLMHRTKHAARRGRVIGWRGLITENLGGQVAFADDAGRAEGGLPLDGV